VCKIEAEFQQLVRNLIPLLFSRNSKHIKRNFAEFKSQSSVIVYLQRQFFRHVSASVANGLRIQSYCFMVIAKRNSNTSVAKMPSVLGPNPARNHCQSFLGCFLEAFPVILVILPKYYFLFEPVNLSDHVNMFSFYLIVFIEFIHLFRGGAHTIFWELFLKKANAQWYK